MLGQAVDTCTTGHNSLLLALPGWDTMQTSVVTGLPSAALILHILPLIAFDKERLYNAVTFENFGLFIDTNSAPQKIFQGRNYSGRMR